MLKRYLSIMFKGFRQTPPAKHLRLRVESCIDIVLHLNERLGEGKIKPEIVKQFERLRESLRYVTDESVDEMDISRIEEATNQLLAEVRGSFEKKKIGSLYEGRPH